MDKIRRCDSLPAEKIAHDDLKQAQLLKKYLAYRKAEILNEIEQNYIAATSSSLWGHS
jgi:hypothetical protein